MLYGCLILSMGLAGCQQQPYKVSPNYPTEASLVANAYGNGLSAEVNIPYLHAYSNLKQAYQRCVAFTAAEHIVFTDNRLEQEIQLGTLFARADSGAYLQKTLVEGLGVDRTRISLYLPKQYRFAKSRFQQDLIRAIGQDPDCNIGIVVPITGEG